MRQRRACGCYMRGGVCVGRADRHGAACVARKACADRGVCCALAAPPWWPRGRSPAPRRAPGRRDALQTRDGRASARGDAWGRRWACRRRVCAALPLQAHLPAAERGASGATRGAPATWRAPLRERFYLLWRRQTAPAAADRLWCGAALRHANLQKVFFVGFHCCGLRVCTGAAAPVHDNVQRALCHRCTHAIAVLVSQSMLPCASDT